MNASSLLHFAGGIGLFLLGMRLMSDGLKVAAGPALRSLLAAGTRSPWRGIGSGVLITALVQSSSAVVFATIGFVNAGLLNLGQAIGVVFGANVGTTLTSWIVALVGFNLDLQALGMPAVAMGMGLWISGGGRRAALGQALVGFGIFFLGLDALKGSFDDLGDALDLQRLAADGFLGALLFAAVGAVLTVLMQSSSATLAVTLTAAAGGMIPLTAAAAMVIGAKVGTTSTALFAVFGATPDAKRAAAAHVAFNIGTAGITLPLLPWLLAAAQWLAVQMGFAAQPATVLAVFHTTTALIGLAVMWPISGWLVAWLSRRFAAAEADEGRPHHLDRHVTGTPRLAIDALDMELKRVASIAHRMARTALGTEPDEARLRADQATLERLCEAVIGYAGSVQAAGDPMVEASLPTAVRVAQYYRAMAERAEELGRNPQTSALAEAHQAWVDGLAGRARDVLQASDPAAAGGIDPATLASLTEQFESLYHQTKARFLHAGSRGELSAPVLVRVLDRTSFLRRVVDQSAKAGAHLARIEEAARSGQAPPAADAA
jgi:phosphate:Na+ symporter